MSHTPQELGFIAADELQRDLTVLKSNPTLLDAFLPSALQSGIAASPRNGVAPLDEYSIRNSSPKDSVALSRAFVDTARNGALKLVADGADGKLGKLGEDIEQVRSEAEQLQRSLEGL